MSSAVVSREGWESIGSLAVVERAQRVRFLDGTDSGSTSCLFYFFEGVPGQPSKVPPAPSRTKEQRLGGARLNRRMR